ncbi:hypothetical protein BSF41_25290 [Flavobacterium sp. ACN2]|uniref:hypothetical protein n=1 Tax=Flavobacterium sp. ACN2 TaxID=1975676 RepID=UPI000BB3112F|nr:hypothetical protein [Flavobacterium sp. ACN2]PBI88401.1 hypothetical protein BSF41_25290 [Flavobacterium sp. ACN2]
MNTKIEWLPIDDWKVLKVIKIEDASNWNYFSGYVYYLRTITPEYNEKAPDFVDQLILNAILEVFPNSRTEFNRNILFKNQLKDTLYRFTGNEDLDFKITFVPYIPYDQMELISKKEVYTYTFDLFFFRTSLNDKDKIKYINTHVQAEIPFDKISVFNDIIKNVEFKK